VRSRNLGNEEAKARYRAVKNTTTMGLTPGKQTNFSDINFNEIILTVFAVFAS
jgi:hypothetical protein